MWSSNYGTNTWIPILLLPIASCESLGKSLPLWASVSPSVMLRDCLWNVEIHLQNAAGRSKVAEPSSTQRWRLKNMAKIKHSKGQCLCSGSLEREYITMISPCGSRPVIRYPNTLPCSLLILFGVMSFKLQYWYLQRVNLGLYHTFH